jgi:hypothetical protein
VRAVRLIALSSLLAAGCTVFIPGVGPRSVASDAAKQAKSTCGAEPTDPRLYGPDLVEDVAPYYRHVMGGPNGAEVRFAGAELRVRPVTGVTEELLERVLLCHSAREMGTGVATTPNDPYVLGDRWVTIDVRSDHGAFVVRVSTEDSDGGREIYARAQAFARGGSG